MRPRLGFSSNLRFLIVIINDYFVRSPLSSARNFSESPKKPTGRVYSTCGAMIFNIPLRGRKVLLMLKHKGVKCCPVGRALCIVRPGGPLRAAWCGSHHETRDAPPIYQEVLRPMDCRVPRFLAVSVPCAGLAPRPPTSSVSWGRPRQRSHGASVTGLPSLVGTWNATQQSSDATQAR